MRVQGFAEFDRPPAANKIPCPASARGAQQDPVVPEDRSTDASVDAAAFAETTVSPARSIRTSASAPPLMMPPARATSGLTHPVACSASLARVGPGVLRASPYLRALKSRVMVMK